MDWIWENGLDEFGSGYLREIVEQEWLSWGEEKPGYVEEGER